MKKIKNYLNYIIDFFKLLLGHNIPFYSFEIIIYTINSITKNNRIYQFFVRKYDPSVSFINYKTAEFIAAGGGDESLNLYRKVVTNDDLLFEKIYKVDSREFKNTYYFYTEIYSQVSALGIEVPQLICHEIGNKLAVMYLEFIEFRKNNNKINYKELFLKYDLALKQLPTKSVAEIENFQLFTSSTTYQRGKNKIIMDFPKEKRKFVEEFFLLLEKYFKRQELSFQHIDFHHNNIVNGKYLIDWDTASYYPKNYDLGTIHSWVMIDIMKQDIDNWELFIQGVKTNNNGVRDLCFEFSLFMHFARFYPELNLSNLFQKFIEDYREKILIKHQNH